MKNVLVIGGDGFIGKYLVNAFKTKYYTSRKNSPYFLDLAKPSLSSIPLSSISHGIIAAACANIVKCEENSQETYQINVAGTLQLVREFVENGIFPILFSSDYVFDGKTGNYDESSALSPINHYGQQKAELETKLHDITQGQHLILRLSKIYALEKGTGTLLDEMAQRLMSQLPLRVATDQVFCPLEITDLVAIIEKLITNHSRGLYNVAGREAVNRFQIATQLATCLNHSSTTIFPIQLNDLNPLLRRPLNTSLCTDKIYRELSYSPLSIQNGIHAMTKLYSQNE